MYSQSLWNNLSIRKKVWGLVLLPTIIIIWLSSRQIIAVNDQLNSLNKAAHVVNVVAQLKRLNYASYESNSSKNISDNNRLKQQHELDGLIALTKTCSKTFLKHEASQYQQLIEEYKETIDAIDSAEDAESKHDAVHWQESVYTQLLLTIEKTHFKSPIKEVENNLQALLQLEWISFWVQEEILQSLNIVAQEDEDLTNLVRDEIRSLIQNQQLFVDRFLAINADRSQVQLLLTAFSNIAFEESNTYREQLLESKLTSQITPQEIKLGEKAFIQRLSLFQDVATSISEQLQQKIKKSISTFEYNRKVFFSVIALSIFILLIFGIALVQRIIANLNTVLKFLEQKDDHENELRLHIDGNDELNKFAIEVERLAIERQKNQRELIFSKDEAINAKEVAVKASKAKSSFLANMSHEIRTPLNGVIGISEILSSTHLNATQKDYVDTIETSSQLLLSLINDILDFSKIESGKLPISPYSTSLRESVYDIAAIVSPKIKEKKLSLKVHIDHDLPYRVLADDHRIRQVLMNLMSNAVKFTGTGSITISIKYENDNEQGKFLFEVIDTGIGIDPVQGKKIFEPFSQEDDSTTREFGGTGLGLAISTQLVELMGGELSLDSEKGKGSRFYFSLQLDIPKQENGEYNLFDDTHVVLVSKNAESTKVIIQELEFLGIVVSEKKKTIDEISPQSTNKPQIIIYSVDIEEYKSIDVDKLSSFNQGNSGVCLIHPLNTKPIDFHHSITSFLSFPLLGNRLKKALKHTYDVIKKVKKTSLVANIADPHRILLVDDNKINQKVASLHIKNLGYEFDIANDGEEAVNMFKVKDYALILMDCMMPIKDGFTATKEIRQFELKHNKKRSVIIALTASVIEGDIQNCFSAGMDDYLPKPFKPEMLKSRIINALSVRNTQEQVQKKNNAETLKNIEPVLTTEILTSSLVKEPNDNSTLNVLIVEDNRINQKVASLILKQKSYQFIIANNGQEAIDIYSKNSSFDIILMDLMMPIKDGFTATEEIRSYEKKYNLKETPIIAVTASVVNDDINECYKAGMNAFIPKPVQAEKLYAEIDNCLDLKI